MLLLDKKKKNLDFFHEIITFFETSRDQGNDMKNLNIENTT